jgi:hypothetical protein
MASSRVCWEDLTVTGLARVMKGATTVMRTDSTMRANCALRPVHQGHQKD